MNITYDSGNLADKKAREIDDFVAATIELMIQKGKFTNLLSDVNDYVAVRELMGRHKQLWQGEAWTFNVAIASDNTGNGTAKFTKLFDTDSSSRVDVMKKGIVYPCYMTANFVYDVREKALNSGEMVQRIDFVEEQMTLMYQSYYDKMETAFWGSPAYANDDVTPAGIKYWIQRQSAANATAHTMGGFDGLDPMLAASSTSATPTAVPRAGLSSSSYARWANWAATYSGVTAADLVKKMRLASRKTNFKSPLKIGEPVFGKGNAVYVNTSTIIALEEILEAQNMNLGNDLASKDGKTLFKGNPVYNVAALDSDATDPVYMLDWSTFGMGVLRGWDKHVSAPTPVADKHNVRAVFLDGSMNFACTNLRNQAVIAKAAS